MNENEIKEQLKYITENKVKQWRIRAIEADPEIMDYLKDKPGKDTMQKTYNVLNGIPDTCKYGNLPTFVSFDKGYKERCGKPSTCKCAHELGMANQRKTFNERTTEQQLEIDRKKSDSYKNNKHNHFKRKTNIIVQPGFEYQTILILLEDIVPERYERTLKCYPELIEFIDLYTEEYNPTSFLEKVYIIQTGPPENTECGKKPTFRNHWYGYNSFCGPKTICECSRKSHSQYMKNRYKNMNENEKITLLKNQQQGMLEKYGEKFSIHVPEIRAKMEESCLVNLGYKTPLESPKIQQLIKQTNLKKYKVEFPFQSSDIRTRALNSTISRHGGLMIQAREVLNLKYNGKNPFQDEGVKELSKQTNLKKYGYDHPRKSPENQKKFIETMMITNGVKWPSQLHINKEVYDILEDESRFTELCKNHSLNELCDLLNVSQGIIKSRHDRYKLNYFKSRVKSRYEDEIAHWLSTNNIDYEHDKRMPWGKTVDFLIDNIAIEFNGLYAHSQYSRYGVLLGIDKHYHYNKYIECKNMGIKLFTIFEDEWNMKKDIIKNKILIALGKGEKGDSARKLKIKEIDYKTSSEFLDVHHLQGSTKSTVYYGAYNTNNVLVAVMNFFERSKGIWDLNRFASDKHIHSGLFSKMLFNFEKDKLPSKLFSFSDNRWGHGDVYLLNGFEKQYELSPDYQVTNYKIREHKFNWRKDRIKSRFGIVTENKTELELTLELKYDRIWDCGKIKWSKSYF